MADNEELDTPSPQDLSHMFTAADLSYRLSYDSAEYKQAWRKAKLIRSSILSTRGCPYASSRELSIALNHKINSTHYDSDRRHCVKTICQYNYPT